MRTRAQQPPGGDDRIDVLVLDAHDPTRLGLALLLRRQVWVGRCVLAEDRPRAVELVHRVRPAVAVVDVSDAGPFAGALLEALRAPHPHMRVVLVARCAGVSGASLRHVPGRFLPAGTPGAELVAAVRDAALDGPAAVELPPADDGLTPREREVLQLLATGATNREIGAQLHLGPDSIKKAASAIYRKLGVRNRTEATQVAALSQAAAPGARHPRMGTSAANSVQSR